jgi:hypothetical protein
MIVSGFDAEWFKPLTAALFGWVLSSLSQHLLARRQRREAINRALSDLLDIRHQLIALDATFKKLREIVLVPPEVEAQLGPILEQLLLPNPEQLSRRYDESVSLIASVDPILAFKLRSKDLLRPSLQRMNALMAQDVQAAIFGQKVKQAVLPHLARELCHVTKSLAWKLGPITRWRIGRALKPPAFHKDASAMMDIVRQEIEKRVQSQPQSPSQSRQTDTKHNQTPPI